MYIYSSMLLWLGETEVVKCTSLSAHKIRKNLLETVEMETKITMGTVKKISLDLFVCSQCCLNLLMNNEGKFFNSLLETFTFKIVI